MNESVGKHRSRGRLSTRCKQHGLSDDYFLPQLRRLLAGAETEREVYDSFVDDVVGSANPMDLFALSQQRPGIYFIEALYRIHREQVEDGDRIAAPSLAPLCYSRWVAWRSFGHSVRSRSVTFGRGVDHYIDRSRQDVIAQVRAGWVPPVVPVDPELIELLANR